MTLPTTPRSPHSAAAPAHVDTVTVRDAVGPGMCALTVYDVSGRPAMEIHLPRVHASDELSARVLAFVRGWDTGTPLSAGPQLMR